MKKTRKLAALMMMVCMAAGAVQGCGDTGQNSPPQDDVKTTAAVQTQTGGDAEQAGQQTTGDKVKFSATFIQNDWHGDPNNMETLTKIAEKANVEVDWQVYPQATWPDKKNLLIASGDVPDVMYMNGALKSSDIAKYAADGMLMDLTDLIPKYAPRLAKVLEEMPNFKAICTNPEDGRIYSIGRAVERDSGYGAKHYINKKWLDQLGLPVPTTVDEFYTALKAFKENDPNGNGIADEIPFTFFGNLEKPNASYSYGEMFGAFGIPDVSSHFIKNPEGEVIYTAMQPEYRDAVAYWHTYVKEGLWDKESFTTPDLTTLTAKGNNDPQLVGAFSAWSARMILPSNYIEDYIMLPPLKGPNGDQTWLFWGSSNNNVTGPFFSITQNAKGKEEAILRWLDEHFDQDTSLELFLGPIGTCLEKDANGYITYIPTPEGTTYSEFRYGNTPVHVPCAMPIEGWDTKIDMMAEDATNLPEVKAVYEEYATYSTYLTIPTTEQSEWLLSRGKDIDQYVNKMQMKWLVEGGIEKDWDNYLAELDKLGIQDYIQLQKDMDAAVQAMGE